MNERQIEKFLDAFMLMEYRGRNHLVAREHYRAVFHELILQYFIPRDEMAAPSSFSIKTPDTSARKIS